MATLVVQTEIVQVGEGVHSVRVQLLDGFGNVIDQEDSLPAEVPVGEVSGPNVLLPRVHIRTAAGGGGVKGGGGLDRPPATPKTVL